MEKEAEVSGVMARNRKREHDSAWAVAPIEEQEEGDKESLHEERFSLFL
jgi:hypothetical protein